MQTVIGCWGILERGGGVEKEYVIIYRRGIVLREIMRYVHCAEINWPPNHPDGVALIKRKNKRLGCEPMGKH